jgi:hypothetical protein
MSIWRTLGVLFSFAYCLSSSHLAYSKGKASSGAGGKTRAAVHLGYAYQGFSIPKSNFTHFDSIYYGLRLTHSWGIWNHGLEYSVNYGSNVNQFTLGDNTKGNYQLDFQRVNLLLGFTVNAFAMHLIVGYETVGWSGSPQLKSETTSFLQYGIDLSYDLPVTPKIRSPIMLTILGHPERKFVFTNYQQDSLTAQSGVEVQIGTGLAVEF